MEGEFYTLNEDSSVNFEVPNYSPNPFDVIPQFLRRVKDAGIDRATLGSMQGGPEAIEYYDTKAKDVQEWMDRGGTEVIAEATEQYKNGTAKIRE